MISKITSRLPSLKLFLALVLLLTFWGAGEARAQTSFTGTYTFGADGNVSSFDYNGTTITNLTVSPLTKNGVTSSSSNNNFRANTWSTGATNGSDTFTGAFDSADYFQFSLTAAMGFQFDMTSIVFGIGRSGTGPRQWQWRSSTDTYGSTISTYTAVNAGLTNTSGVLTNPDSDSSWTANTLDLSGTSYDDLSTITFRFYGYNAEAGTGSGGFQGPLTFSGVLSSTSSSILYWLGSDTTRGGSGTWANTGGTAWSATDADGAGTAWDSTKTAIFNTAAATVTVSGTVNANNGITFATGSNGSTITGGTGINLGGATVAVNAISVATGVTATIGTSLTGSSGMTKSGDGTLILSGDNSGLSGSVDFATGTLLVGHNSALGTGTVTMAGGTTLAANDATARSLANNLTVNGDVTFGQASGGTGGLTITGTVGLGSANRKITVNNPLTVFQGAVTGTGDFDKEGAGTLRFGAATHNIGSLDINGGLVDLAAGATVNSAMGASKTWDGGLSGSGALNITVSGNRTLQLNSTVDSSGYAGAITHSGGGAISVRSVLNPLGTGVLTVATTNTVILANGSSTGVLGNSSIALNPNNEAGFQLNIGASSPSSLTVGAITEAGSESSSVSFQNDTSPGGAGTLTINGASTYGGATLFNGSTSFTFKNGINNALPTTTAVTMGATNGQGGVWDLNGYNQTVAALSSGAGGGSITNTGALASTLTVNGATDTTFSFVIGNGSGGVALAKEGSSTLTLSNANTYSGTTTISGGILRATNSTGSATGSGNVTVASGGTLAGSGIIAPASGGTITVESGGRLAIGEVEGTTLQGAKQLTLQAASGTITTTFVAGSFLEFDLFSGGGDQTANLASADRLIINGTAVFNGTLTFKALHQGAFAFANGDKWRLLDWSTLVDRSALTLDTPVLPSLTGGLLWDTSDLFMGGTLAIVPEPSRAVLIGLGLVGLVLRRRRI